MLIKYLDDRNLNTGGSTVLLDLVPQSTQHPEAVTSVDNQALYCIYLLKTISFSHHQFSPLAVPLRGL